MGEEVTAWFVGLAMGGVVTARILSAHPNWVEPIGKAFDSIGKKATQPKQQPKQKQQAEVKTPLPEFREPDSSALDKQIGKGL